MVLRQGILLHIRLFGHMKDLMIYKLGEFPNAVSSIDLSIEDTEQMHHNNFHKNSCLLGLHRFLSHFL